MSRPQIPLSTCAAQARAVALPPLHCAAIWTSSDGSSGSSHGHPVMVSATAIGCAQPIASGRRAARSALTVAMAVRRRLPAPSRCHIGTLVVFPVDNTVGRNVWHPRRTVKHTGVSDGSVACRRRTRSQNGGAAFVDARCCDFGHRAYGIKVARGVPEASRAAPTLRRNRRRAIRECPRAATE